MDNYTILQRFASDHNIDVNIKDWMKTVQCQACAKGKYFCKNMSLQDGFCIRHSIPKKESCIDDLLEKIIPISDT